VAKSKELTSTVIVLGWLVGGWLLMGFMYGRMALLFEKSLAAMQQPFRVAVAELGALAFETLLWLSLPLLALAVFLGLVTEFLQVGPVATMKKLTPDIAKMNPVEGIKKMFSMDNL